ncbi:T9SS type A sorting domain-containing protein [candidate division WOR-3 bacterium]|nr:T9SS type A sorting domain-containing protein [candidate division WOR-3 bacterium]
MKTSRIALAGLVIAVMSTSAFGWVQEPNEATGYYYMYDNEPSSSCLKYFLPALPEPPYSVYCIWFKPEAEKLDPYDTRPYKYELEDSFWYCGYWFVPGQELAISPDGHLTFDVDYYEYPSDPPQTKIPIPNPDDPNEVLAVLWADFDPTSTPGEQAENRIYYLYDSESRLLTVEWYKVKHADSENEYMFLATLQFGGQELLDVASNDEVMISHHYAHFLYYTASGGWDADYTVIGMEDMTGELGISYEGIIDEDSDNFHVIRTGYLKMFPHDVGVIEITNLEGHPWGNTKEDLYPAGTEFTLVASVENFGFNAEDSIEIDLEIYDADKGTGYCNPESLVWHTKQVLSFIDWKGNQEENPYRAEVTFPSWKTPADHWYWIWSRTELTGDDCPENDDCNRHINVGIAETPADLPFALEQIRFEASTRTGAISYSLRHQAKVSLKVYSADGRLVKTLVDDTKQVGRHEVTWDGQDEAGCDIPSGIYLFRMEADDWSETEKVIIVH